MLLERAALALPAITDTTHYGLIDIDIAVPNFDVVAALGIGANPSFVLDGGPLAAEVRQRH